MKIVLAGAVSSTLTTLKKLIEHKMEVVGVLGYEPESTRNVSGYSLLQPIARANNIAYMPFSKINDAKVVQQLKNWQPDIIFIVGLSQLVKDEILSIPPKGIIGFHPTALPKGRGRAPIAWAVLKEKLVGANFFIMDSGVDSGDILVQELFPVEDNDYAEDIEIKILKAIEIALDKLLPTLKKGIIKAQTQNEDEASYYGRRTPNDGCINWHNTAKNIQKLIRASSRPHPGAFTFNGDTKVIIWKAEIEKTINYTGVVGRILKQNDKGHLLVQTGDGLLWITEYEVIDFDENILDKSLKVGQMLGYYSDLEIYKLKKEIKKLKKLL